MTDWRMVRWAYMPWRWGAFGDAAVREVLARRTYLSLQGEGSIAGGRAGFSASLGLPVSLW